MSTSTMHFGPEWMRPKHQATPRTQPPSPPPVNPPNSGLSTYSALVSPAPLQQVDSQDEAHPFRYSKEELFRIYKEGGGKGGLGLEVERWEGVVREYGSDPVGLREMGEAEKKLFAGPLNSDIRRRQSSDYLSLSTTNLGSDRSRLSHNASSVASPMRERFGNMKRRDSAAESPNSALPRKQSLSSLQAPVVSPREIGLPSPRTRVGYTPSFDGVLNGGDSWVARRRLSEASQKAGGIGSSTNRGGEGEDLNERAGGIREETEEENSGNASVHGPLRTQDNNFTASNDFSSSQRAKDVDGITGDIGQLLLGTNIANAVDTAIGPPPGLTDPGSVEWSYKDPTGTVQGPFRADLMQKWFDDGYFASDLPMKRTHLDTTWSTVEQLLRRCDSDRIFLSPLHPAPPGLSLRNDSPLQHNTTDQNMNGPYQPAPIRSLLTSTLESYISAGSNHSESPSSSLGAGRFGDSSPEPNTFGGSFNGQFYNGDPSGSARGSGFHTTPEIPLSLSGRRGLHTESPNDPSLGLRPGTLNTNLAGRTSNVDGFAFSNTYNSIQGPWGTSSNISTGFEGIGLAHDAHDHIGLQNYSPGLGINFGELRPSQDPATDSSHVQAVNYTIGPEHAEMEEKLYGQYAGFNLTPGAGHEQIFSPPSNQHPNTQLQQLHQHIPPSDPTHTQRTGFQNTIPINPPRWPETSVASVRRINPFENPQPTSSNTVSHSFPAPTQSSPWDQATPSVPIPDNATPWVVASHGVTDRAWGESDDSASPVVDVQTTTDVQDSPANQAPPSMTSTQSSEEFKPEPQFAEAIVSPTVSPSTAVPPSSAKPRKGSQSTQTTILRVVTSPPQSDVTSPQISVPKPVWQKEDETKKTISLREIQEAEAKRAEVRKTVERERERAARVVSPSNREGVQPFIASWGLPTSQAGSRANLPSAKEAGSSPTPATTTPVWTSAPKVPARKSMKEIQEEEKRKKMATSTSQATAAATVATTLPRRLYAESSAKPPAPSSGGAWTTVGPNGKANAVPVVSSPRPPGAPSTLPAPRSTNGPAPPRPVQPPVTKPAPATLPRAEDISPSHEFLNWLNDSLKGLNNSVNVEEIMNMLLSFPIDADSTTREIISDLIYANSTIMDGRRFADEFVSKRKADAIARAKRNGASKGPTKLVSIADVVKAAPKTTQPEWGFKVVNKKKKGGRS